MEDRRTALAIVLSMIVVLMYSQTFMSPPPAPSPTGPATTVTTSGQQERQNSLSAPTEGGQPYAPGTTPAGASGATQAVVTRAQVDAAGSVAVKTDLFLAQVTLLGGRLRSLTLNRYAHTLGSEERVELVEEEATAPFPLALSSATENDSAVLYRIAGVEGVDGTDSAVGRYELRAGEGSITLMGEHPTWGTVTKKIALRQDGYLIGVQAAVSNGASTPIGLEWNHALSTDPQKKKQDPWQIALLDQDGDLERENLEKVTASFEGKGLLRWAALGGRYFQAALIASEGTTSFGVGRSANTVSLKAVGSTQGGEFRLFAGPKDHETLIATGFDLRRTIDLGVFTFLADPLLQLLRFFYWILGNYGLAIILLILTIKIAFYPLTAVGFKSMQKMQELQPEMEKLRAKYKDATELNQAVMELYKKKGVNPLGGCFPMLIQVPVFIGLYNALLQSIELRHQPFALWVTDLSSPEKLILFGVPIPLMIIVMGIAMIWQQWTTPTTGDPLQKKIGIFMTLVFAMMFFAMPAGLVLYMLINNITSITQQIYLRNAHGAHPFVATMITSVVLFLGGYIAVLTTT